MILLQFYGGGGLIGDIAINAGSTSYLGKILNFLKVDKSIKLTFYY
jgi:hypothetical protein